jgi:hypothetical protein
MCSIVARSHSASARGTRSSRIRPHAQWLHPQRGQFTAAGIDRDQIQHPQVEGRGLEACWLGLELGLDGTVFVVECVQSLSLLEPDQRVIACTHPGGYVVGELL